MNVKQGLEEKRELPPGWRWAKLATICDIRNGGTPSRENMQFWSGTIPWVSPKDMKTHVIRDTEDHISREAIDQSATSLTPAGTILAVVRSGILAHHFPLAITGREVTFNQDIKALLPKVPAANSNFLIHILRSKEREILSEGIKRGATVHSVRTGYLENLEIPFPPLSEQKRIAGILNERMAAIDKARAAAQAQLEAAKDLRAAYLGLVFPKERVELLSGWRISKLEKVCKRIDYGFTASSTQSVGGPRFLRITDIRDGYVDWNNVPSCDIDELDELYYALADGDIVFARTGATTGKSYLVQNPPRAVFASYLIRLRVNREEIDPCYLYSYFQSALYWRSISMGVRGGAQGGFNAAMLSQLAIPFPPLEEQKKLIGQIDRVFKITRGITEGIDRQLNEINALPQALLRQAFNGEL